LATVITNLLSAIPWIGKDFVESHNYMELILSTIGIVSPHALKKGNKIRGNIEKTSFLSIPYSFLAMLVGFIDGDGYILINKTTKGFIKINLTISLNINDLSTLNYIQSVLRLGKITVYPKSGIKDTCKLIINRTDLQEILFPLILHYKMFFLTNTRRDQFEKAIFILKNNIKLFSDIHAIIPSLHSLPASKEDYVSLPFFKNWIVGFTNAEGSFLIKSNQDACFQLRQRTHLLLFESFNIIFGSNKKIGLDNNAYNLFSVSSKSDIQQVINFFSFSGHHPLLGQKLIQYENWLNYLRNSKRYHILKLPD